MDEVPGGYKLPDGSYLGVIVNTVTHYPRGSMIVHAEVHCSPAAGLAELVETFDGYPEAVLADAMHLLVHDQLPHGKPDDEFTVNVVVLETGRLMAIQARPPTDRDYWEGVKDGFAEVTEQVGKQLRDGIAQAEREHDPLHTGGRRNQPQGHDRVPAGAGSAAR